MRHNPGDVLRVTFEEHVDDDGEIALPWGGWTQAHAIPDEVVTVVSTVDTEEVAALKARVADLQRQLDVAAVAAGVASGLISEEDAIGGVGAKWRDSDGDIFTVDKNHQLLWSHNTDGSEHTVSDQRWNRNELHGLVYIPFPRVLTQDDPIPEIGSRWISRNGGEDSIRTMVSVGKFSYGTLPGAMSFSWHYDGARSFPMTEVK